MFEYYCLKCKQYSYAAQEYEKLSDRSCPYCGEDSLLYSPRQMKQIAGLEKVIQDVKKEKDF